MNGKSSRLLRGQVGTIADQLSWPRGSDTDVGLLMISTTRYGTAITISVTVTITSTSTITYYYNYYY